MRCLFVVPPLVGHLNPTLALGTELLKRGHQVAWVGHPSVVAPRLPAGAEFFRLDEGDVRLHEERVRAGAEQARGLQAFKQLWEEFFIPLARAMLPGVTDAVARFAPDRLLVDQQAYAGALVARRQGLRWATLATTTARLVDSLSTLPKVLSWVQAQFAQLEQESGLPSVADPDLSPALLLVFSSELLAGEGRFPKQAEFVGPVLGRAEDLPFPWDRLRPGNRLLVSLGTLNAGRGGPLYRALVEAFAGSALQVIIAAPPELVAPVREDLPENFIVQPRVPQLALLPHLSAVVCHAGHNTVCEALSAGLPLLVLPIRDDQPVIAQQVVDAGAGLRLRFGRTTAAELTDAVKRLLSEPSFREAAGRVQRSFAAAGGVEAAGDAVEALA